MQPTHTQHVITQMAQTAPLSLPEIVSKEVQDFFHSRKRHEMLEAKAYYDNRSQVQHKEPDFYGRTNTRIEHPLYKRVIDQKLRHLLGKPWRVRAGNEDYAKALATLFDHGFRRRIRTLSKCAIRDGIAFLQPVIDQQGNLKFRNLPASEVIPLWEDGQEVRLGGFIHVYPQCVYEGKTPKTIHHADLWDSQGVQRFEDDGQGRFQAMGGVEPHFFFGGVGVNWNQIPLVFVRYNDEGLPLLRFTKDLIDDYNWQTSLTADALRDVAKFVYVLKNYGGEDINQFVGELRRSLAIQVEEGGGVEKLQPEVNVENVLSFLDKQRRDLYEFSAAVDTRDPELGSASGKAIAMRYADLEADCQDLAGALRAMFVHLKPFLDLWCSAKGFGSFHQETFEVVFNTQMVLDESERIANLKASEDLLSLKTLVENHPFVVDVEEEWRRLEAQF